MTTRTWSELQTLLKGLCGVTSFETTESDLVASFINRRLYRAYKASDYWPRYLVIGEARNVSGDYIPFTQAQLNTIDTFLRIYDAEPYASTVPVEYDFNVSAGGALVNGGVGDTTTFYCDYKKIWDGPFNSTTNDDIPQEFFEYACHGAYSDFLRYDKQTDKAALAEAEAEAFLQIELANPMIARTAQVAGRRIRTHSTSQSR
jgi:hypothetical protein